MRVYTCVLVYSDLGSLWKTCRISTNVNMFFVEIVVSVNDGHLDYMIGFVGQINKSLQYAGFYLAQERIQKNHLSFLFILSDVSQITKYTYGK